MKMSDTGGVKKKLFDAACAAAREKRELAEQGKSSVGLNMKFKVLDKLVFSKIREAMGGRVIGALTASAAMNKEIAEFFCNIGVPTYDCYKAVYRKVEAELSWSSKRRAPSHNSICQKGFCVIPSVYIVHCYKRIEP